MLKYHFTSKLITTEDLLKDLKITISNLNYWKTQWRKSGNDDWDMGLRIIGRRALWDPILFLGWLNNNKLKNKPKDQRDINLIAFVGRNSSEESEKLMTIKNKITINPKKMLDGYDGVLGKEYLWQILEDQKTNPKYAYEVRILKHLIPGDIRKQRKYGNGKDTN